MSKQRYVFAIIAAFMVLSLGPLLVAIGARSPYTHAQLLQGPDSDYTRTEQTIVGSPVPYSGEGLASQPQAGEDLVSLGQKLLAARGCAFCHGLTGQGGVVGPPIAGFEAQLLRVMTDLGPDGMPAYAHGALSDDDLLAIAAYLKEGVRPSTVSEPTSTPPATLPPSPTTAATTTVAPSPSAQTPTASASEPTTPVETGDLIAPVASITVDGDATDWSAIVGLELTLEPVLGLDVPTQDIEVKVAHDSEFIYTLLLVDDDYHWNPSDHHLVVSPAMMWAIDADAGPHMGTDGVNLTTSTGMVDIWHWQIRCAAGEEQGGAAHGPGEGMDPGIDGICHLDDQWSTTPFEREADSGDGAENSLLGVWTHSNPIDGGEGTYVFEIRRPLVTGDSQDAQFAAGELARLAIAYWDPDSNLLEPEQGWVEAQHVQSAYQGWIEVVFE